MATKEQIRNSILELEPENVIANQGTSSHKDLKAEFAAVKRREEMRTAQSALPVMVSFRLEDKEYMSWKLVDKSTGEPMTRLFYGMEMPVRGELITIDVDNAEQPVTVCVHGQEQDLDILASDLPDREVFDSRRIYTTPNGTNVTFQREERGRIVLWSYKSQMEIAIGGSNLLERTDRMAPSVARKKRKMTQKILAAYLISQDPDITKQDLSALLKEAFPSANISVDGRHGAHYLSLSRTGKLPVASEDDPRTW